MAAGPISDIRVRRFLVVWLGAGVVLALLQSWLFDSVLWILTPFTLLGFLLLGAVLAGYVAWRELDPPTAAVHTAVVGLGAIIGLILGAFLGFLALGGYLAVYAGRRALRGARVPPSTLSLAHAAVFGLALAAVPLARLGSTATFHARFRLNRAEYSRTVDSLLAAGPTSRDTVGTVLRMQGYLVDLGPPVRVAFPLSAKVSDNWTALVYDPTGSVRAAQGWSASGEFTAPPEVRRLFLGDLLGCSHLEGPWYRCSFT